MLEFFRYQARRRLRGTAALSGAVVALVALYLWIWPSIERSGVDFEEYVEAFPPALRELFGIRSLGTVEGFLAAELYGFVWVLLLGVYAAYAAASTIAGDAERDRLDVVLALPVTRARVLTERALALLVPLVAVNVVTPAALLVGLTLLAEPVSVADLLVVHALSLPYLGACAGVGLVASVSTRRAGVAQRIAGGTVFGLFVVESVTAGGEYAALGALSPSRYYDPTAVLLDSAYDLAGAAGLLAGALALYGVSVAVFRRRDVV